MLSWNTQSSKNSELNKPDDRLKIICLDQSRQKAFVNNKSPRRSEGEIVVDIAKLIEADELQINENTKKINLSELHFWVYITSSDYTKNSGSVYLNVSN